MVTAADILIRLRSVLQGYQSCLSFLGFFTITMYDRAPRSLTQPSGSTLESVGPGTYESLANGRNKSDGYAPFSSMTGRETFLDVSDSVMAAPGPGQYDPGIIQERVRGGHTLANKGIRFQKVKSKTPGPGSYNLSKRSDWLREVHNKPEQEVEQGVLVKDGSLFKTTRITFKRKPDPPSIPFPGQAYGFEEAPDGSLRKQNMPQRDNTMGPAFYNVNHGDTAASKKYRGAHFGNRTSRRMQFRGAGGPGPGQYDPFQESVEKAPIDLVIEERKRQPFESRLPRYHEVIALSEEKKAVPGPGKYEIKSQFVQKAPAVVPQDEPVVNAPFGTQAKRFADSTTGTPAPGTYNDPRNALESLKRTTGLKRSPFGQTSVRFHDEHRVKKTPGPGTYNISDITTEALRKAHIESSRKGGFGTTSSRIAPMTRRHEHQLPGPAHYITTAKPKSKEIVPSSTFASATGRLTTPPGVVIDNPPPGSYEVTRSYDHTQGKVLYPHAQHRSKNAKKSGAFMSSAVRFDNQRKALLMETADPGPGHYEVVGGSPKPGGLMVTKQRRFTDIKEENPGPGTYELSPLQMHTVLKGTFNATLNNPVANAYDDMEQRSPSKQAFLLGV